MALVTLTVGTDTFTFQEGDLDQVHESIQGGPEQSTVAGTGPMGTYVYDYEGVTKVIKINGFLTDATSTRVPSYSIDTIYEQKQWLESLLNGGQTAITFTSTYGTQSIVSTASPTAPYKGGFTNTKAKVQSMNFYEISGDPNRLKFDITLLVGV